jgi:hypothetical protein
MDQAGIFASVFVVTGPDRLHRGTRGARGQSGSRPDLYRHHAIAAAAIARATRTLLPR